jgi:hypothetical protein
MNKGFSKMAVRALIIGGVAVVALVTAARRCDQPRQHASVQEGESESPAPANRPAVTTPARRPPALLPPTAPVPSSAPAGLLNEPQLMVRLRSIKDSNPAAAIDLARDGNRRFPDSADAPERHSILIHALANAEQRSEARGEAEQMVNHYPDSDWVREIEGFTGAHRHRNLRLNDAGEVVSY